MNKDEAFFSRAELCRLLKISISSLKRAEAKGRLKPIRLGPRTIRFRQSDVEAFLTGKSA